MSYHQSTEDCEIVPASDFDGFSFSGQAGDEIRIVLLQLSGGLEPGLFVRDPDLISIYLDSCFTVGCTLTYEATLTKTGTYLLTVGDDGANQTGEYEIGVHCLSGPCTVLHPALHHDQPRGLPLSPATSMNRMTFDGTLGAEPRITVVQTGASLEPRLEIWDPDGVKLHDESCITAGCSMQVEPSDFNLPVVPPSALPKSGIYQLAVSDQGSDQTGTYSINIQCLVGDCDSDSDGVPDGVPALLFYGTPRTPTISPITDEDTFLFDADAAVSLTITVTETGGGLHPRLEVWDPLGSKVGDIACFGAGCSAPVLLPATSVAGTYSVNVSSVLVGGGLTGSYSLDLTCVSGSCGDSSLIPPMGDNCIDVPNGPAAFVGACDDQQDGDPDGYGSPCDFDANGDGATGLDDLGAYLVAAATVSTDPVFDSDCDGAAGLSDVSAALDAALQVALPGRSGLNCAGNIGCQE